MNKKKNIIFILLFLFCFCILLCFDDKKIIIASPKKNDVWVNIKTISIRLKGFKPDSIEKVEFYIDGKLIREFSSPPYIMKFNFGQRIKYRSLKVLVKGIRGILKHREIHSLDVDDYQEVSVSQIIIPVVVLDSRGNYIKDLKKEDFILIVDNQQQLISHFSKSGKTQFHLVLLIDISSSMKDKIGAVKDAAKLFLQQLITKEDRAIIVFFNHDVFEDTDFTNNIEQLRNSISMTYPFGATALYDAIAYCYKLIRGVSGHNIIIIFSDGEDNSSHIDPYTLIKKVEKSNTTVYSIRNESIDTDVHYQTLLKKISSISGGITFKLDDIRNIKKVYYKIRRDIKAQYVLYFSMRSNKKLKRFRRIIIKLKKKRGYKIRTIKGFYY